MIVARPLTPPAAIRLGTRNQLSAKATNAPEAAAYVSIATLRPLIGIAMQQIPIEPEYEKYRELVRTISMLKVEVQTQGRLKAVVSAISDTEEQAAKTEELLGDALQLGLAKLIEAVKFEMDRAPVATSDRQAQATLIYFNRLAERVKTWYQPRRDGTRVLARRDRCHDVDGRHHARVNVVR